MSATSTEPSPRPWWRELDRYMWWVLIVAALGWVFDVMDQRIFVQSRNHALDELLAVEVDEASLRSLTAGQIEDLLGFEKGIDPGAVISILEPSEPTKRPSFTLPPLTSGKTPRTVFFIRPPEAPGKALVAPEPDQNTLVGRIATAIFLVGWATGGLLFGILGDKWGRAFTMMLTILVYSVFTGLSALSVSWIDYSAYRFMTGMGVGGEFAAGAALVAEVMPGRARPYALGLLQALSAVGNIIGSLVALVVLPAVDAAHRWHHWRALYLVGILPALLIVIIRWRLKEPERWKSAKESASTLVGKQLGAFGDLFAGRWRRNTIVGMLLAVAGVIGLWGIGFWTPELIKPIAGDPKTAAWATALQDVGGFLGIAAVTVLTQGAPRTRMGKYGLGFVTAAIAAGVALVAGAGDAGAPWATTVLGVSLAFLLYFGVALIGSASGGLGRRLSFAISFLFGLAATVAVFRWMTQPGHIFWAIPILGFSTLMCFGLYAIYFPELYPTRLRTTGTGFCYNVARYIAAGGLFLLGYLGTLPGFDFRTSAQVFALIYVVGIAASFFAPETKDRPLAEDG